MHADHPLDEATTEALLAGRTTPDGELEALVGFLQEMRAVGHAPAPPPSAALASVLASGLTTDKGDLAATPASNVTGPAPQVAGLPKWRRRTMVETLLSGIVAKLAALGVAAKAGLGLSMAAASVGGAAVAGVPVAQDAVEAVTPVEFGGGSVDENLGDDQVGTDVDGEGLEETPEPAGPPADTHGATVSEVARTTPPGPSHGAVVSEAASQGRSRAGTGAPEASGAAPVATPHAGGTATADAASGGASSVGTGIANEASGGRAAAGSGNAEAGLSRRR